MRYYSEATVNGIIHDMYQGNHISKATDYPSIEITDSSWHTGEPTEEGWYLITDGQGNYDVTYWLIIHVKGEEDNEGEWDSTYLDDIVAWQKIEPYKED